MKLAGIARLRATRAGRERWFICAARKPSRERIVAKSHGRFKMPYRWLGFTPGIASSDELAICGRRLFRSATPSGCAFYNPAVKIVIYQKPTCTTCRQVHAALKESGVDFEAVDYYL